jgi:hypothetical protein
MTTEPLSRTLVLIAGAIIYRKDTFMKAKTFFVMILLLALLATGTMEARTSTGCQTALNMCMSWCGSYFANDGFVDFLARNGCRLGCLAGYSECMLAV